MEGGTLATKVPETPYERAGMEEGLRAGNRAPSGDAPILRPHTPRPDGDDEVAEGRGLRASAGDFLMETSEEERGGYRTRGSWPSCCYGEEGTSEGYGGDDYSLRRRRRSKMGKYGHQEDDEAFFAQKFGVAQDALHTLDLGDDFKYPSDKAFKKHFPYCDFQKAMKNGGLPKFNRTVRISGVLKQLL